MEASKSLASSLALVNLVVFRWKTCNLLTRRRSKHFSLLSTIPIVVVVFFSWGKLLTDTTNRPGIVIIYVTALIWIGLLA